MFRDFLEKIFHMCICHNPQSGLVALKEFFNSFKNPEAPGMHNSAGGYTAGSRFDSHTRVSYKRNAGYFERVGSSFCGAFVGIFILLSGFPLLFWNEVRGHCPVAEI